MYVEVDRRNKMNKKVSLLLVALLILSVFVNPLISTAEMRVDKDLGFIEEIGEIQMKLHQ